MIETAIVALLRAAGTDAGDRIDPLTLPRDPVFPAITYQTITTPRDVSHDGDQGYADFRVDISCWTRRTDDGSGYARMKALADQVRLALNGFRGTAAGVEVGLIQVSGGPDANDPERKLERALLNCTGNFREAKPA